jgi:eukaryotic-like serine/threonine-protein kinase
MVQCPRCGRHHANGAKECEAKRTSFPNNIPAPAEHDDKLIGRVLDEKYSLDERLDEGGMGTVYRGTHLLIDRPVAIKVLNSRFADNEAAHERFRREARAAGRIRHINAAAVTDFGRTPDGVSYVVMELLEGRSLQDVLAREGPLDTARAVAVMLQISAAVASAHEEGVIHRDLKPGNVFVVKRAYAPTIIKVLDFGIAELASDSVVTPNLEKAGGKSGTPRYMSPEQSEITELTPASDVYSLGIILYEMLTGTTPFSGESPSSLASRHTSELPRSPREFVSAIPHELEELVLGALEKSPHDRPKNAGIFRVRLYETAQRLGLEHSEGFNAPTLDSLRNAGRESPSGRLVIDIGRLRENRSARVRAAEPNVNRTSEVESSAPGLTVIAEESKPKSTDEKN